MRIEQFEMAIYEKTYKLGTAVTGYNVKITHDQPAFIPVITLLSFQGVRQRKSFCLAKYCFSSLYLYEFYDLLTMKYISRDKIYQGNNL